jgi:predicted Zn-ribbon and HTH transcriptional regulator
MTGPTRTSRQQIMDLITGTPHTSRDLAQALRMSEREIEGHLTHIARSVSRDPTRTFMLQPAVCDSCGFVFSERTRLTRPSRCPRCRSERVSAPRYEIQQGTDDQ